MTKSMTRRVRYQVAMSLDGYIAGPRGEADWIVMDPDIDFNGLFAQFDTILMGRVTYESMRKQHGGGEGSIPGITSYVFSTTLRQEDCPGATLVSGNVKERVTALKAKPGKDIWLFGGGSLFRSLLEMGLVDTVEPAIVPVVLGSGVPLLPSTARKTKLALTAHKRYSKSGIVLLEYSVEY